MNAEDFQHLLSVGEDQPASAADPRLARLVALSARMGDTPPDHDAPEREVISRLGDSWSPLILAILATGAYRHTTLKRVVGALSAEGEVSQRMLTLRLRALERDGFVRREVQDVVPQRVYYHLTPMGQDLVQELGRLLDWIESRHTLIQAARARFIP